MKIFILTDGLGWIVDRITDKIIQGLPEHEFIKAAYPQISTDDFVRIANECDLVHYNNWDIKYHIPGYKEIKKPFIYTFRSHRYPDYCLEVAEWASRVVVINILLQSEIDGSDYIPDGIEDYFFTDKPFIVGYAGQIDDYKGVRLIKQACDELGCRFVTTTNLPPENMPDFYRSIDLYVCASVAEGHSTPVMECLAMNVPVVTVPVGVPYELNVHFAEARTVEALKDAISKFYTRPQVEDFRWDKIIARWNWLYKDTLKKYTL